MLGEGVVSVVVTVGVSGQSCRTTTTETVSLEVDSREVGGDGLQSMKECHVRGGWG